MHTLADTIGSREIEKRHNLMGPQKISFLSIEDRRAIAGLG